MLGSRGAIRTYANLGAVIPVHAGIDGFRSDFGRTAWRGHRACEDGRRASQSASRTILWLLPSTRGSMELLSQPMGRVAVGPAHAGIEATSAISLRRSKGGPRACGDGRIVEAARARRRVRDPSERGLKKHHVWTDPEQTVGPADEGFEGAEPRPPLEGTFGVPALRGLTGRDLQESVRQVVCPARAGIEAASSVCPLGDRSAPRECGD